MAGRTPVKHHLSILISAFCFLPALHATTYYIDYASGSNTNAGTSTNAPFQSCPGMATFPSSAYTPTPGDIFVFKGGVTWPAATLPLTIPCSGTVASPMTYTVNSNWYSGTAWSGPILNGNMALGPNNYGIYANFLSNILIDGLGVINIGDPTTGTGTSITIFDGSGIEVRNCLLSPQGLQAFAFANSTTFDSNIFIHNNTIAQALRCVVYGTQGIPISNLCIYSNIYQGPGSMNSGGYHEDGWMIGVPTHPAISNAAVINVQFFDNYFYGDWSAGATAQFYSLGGLSNVLMYNNVFAYENTSETTDPCFSPGFVYFQNDANVAVYNNTFSGDACTGYISASNLMKGVQGALWFGTPWPGTTNIAENNIFSGCHIDIEADSSPGSKLIFNYNLHNPDTSHLGDLLYYGSTQYSTLAGAQGAGFELNSPAVASPQFVNVPTGSFALASGNWRLQNVSPAIGAGTNLSSFFTTDKDGNPRPATEPWTIGAYQTAAGSQFGYGGTNFHGLFLKRP